MQIHTPIEYLKIDIANCFGFDKSNWVDRLCWFNINVDNLELLTKDAEEPLLYIKAIDAYRTTMKGEPTGHNMFLDATASG